MNLLKEKLEKNKLKAEQKKELQTVIRRLIEDKMLTGRDIAEILGVREETVSRIKNDDTFSLGAEKVKEYLSKLKA